jgi:hypothetical protein
MTNRLTLAAGPAMPFISTRVKADLPDIPAIPEKLKGSGEIRIARFGG